MSLVTFDLPSTGTMQQRPAEFAKLSKKYEERSSLSTVQRNFLQKSRSASISRHSTYEYATYVIREYRERDCCHAITREAGRESARALTRVAGKESGFTLLTRAKSLSKPYFPATTRDIRTHFFPRAILLYYDEKINSCRRAGKVVDKSAHTGYTLSPASALTLAR